jgi:hypothetical protein
VDQRLEIDEKASVEDMRVIEQSTRQMLNNLLSGDETALTWGRCRCLMVLNGTVSERRNSFEIICAGFSAGAA